MIILIQIKILVTSLWCHSLDISANIHKLKPLQLQRTITKLVVVTVVDFLCPLSAVVLLLWIAFCTQYCFHWYFSVYSVHFCYLYPWFWITFHLFYINSCIEVYSFWFILFLMPLPTKLSLRCLLQWSFEWLYRCPWFPEVQYWVVEQHFQVLVLIDEIIVIVVYLPLIS